MDGGPPMKTDDPKNQNSYGSYLAHPTTIPHMIMSVGIVILLVLFLIMPGPSRTWLIPGFGIFACFMYGISGLIAVIGGESATARHGIIRGWRAYLLGGFQILVGWGIMIALIIQQIRK